MFATRRTGSRLDHPIRAHPVEELAPGREAWFVNGMRHYGGVARRGVAGRQCALRRPCHQGTGGLRYRFVWISKDHRPPLY